MINISHLADFEQVTIKISHFADCEQVTIKIGHFADFEHGMAAFWDGCFLVFLLTLNKPKNLVVILLALNKPEIILLILNKSKKLVAKLPWEKPDTYAFFV